MSLAALAPTNVPCARCGAPMREVPHAHAHLASAVEMACAYCGARESLPADEQQRVLALRSLLLQRQWAREATSGPALAYLKVLENLGMHVGPYVFGIVLIVATVLTGSGQSFRGSAPALGVMTGCALASFIAMRAGRRRLRAVIGPLIRAWPGSPGRPHRCRRCGAELPLASGAFVECRYCQAANLSSRDAAVEDATRLRDETQRAQIYAADTAAHVTATGVFVRRAVTTAFFVGAGLGGLLGATIATYG